VATGCPEKRQRDSPLRTAKRRVALVLSIVRGETSVAEAARKHGLTIAEIEEWQERFVAAAENALRSRPKDRRGAQGRADQEAQAEGGRARPRSQRPVG